ncbi:hypothetical protein CYMTET_23663 [Cymbomonas tetramitiformis]|uniref:Uncharacterized protein n=1 Tax=Cymbomonas tetramitiformis TaxID=36881 RepID=A0AAE0L115_9CHLO|nr:hypothetical protein CYMTET_23663 [Cymbomonas tetramitiformis]
MVAALRESFMTEDGQLDDLFTLDDATITGTSDLLSLTLDFYGVDPNDSIMDFNAALITARRKNTLDEEDIKGQFIRAMHSEYFYQPVVTRLLLLHDQRAAVDLLTV